MTTTKELIEWCCENIDNMELALEIRESGFIADDFRKWIPIYRAIRARLEAAEKIVEVLVLIREAHEGYVCDCSQFTQEQCDDVISKWKALK